MALQSIRNRSCLIIAIVFLAGTYIGSVSGTERKPSETPVVISAQKFVLVDKKGHERGVWEAGDDSASLVFLDESGKDWVTVSAVMKEDGMAYISIGPDDHTHCHASMVSFGPCAAVEVFDPRSEGANENHPKAVLKTWKGTPVLELKNPPKKSQVKLSDDENGPKIELYDKRGNVSWSAPQSR